MKTKKLTFLNKLLKIQKQQKKIFFIKKKKEKNHEHLSGILIILRYKNVIFCFKRILVIPAGN